MKHLTFIIAVALATSVSFAQETRVETTTPASWHDTLANSDTVPEAYSVEGKLDRVIVIRMKYKTDLLAGIEKAVRANGIRNAVILAGTGSVISYHYHAVSNLGFPTRNIFVKNESSPADLVSMNGYVIDGRVHAHATFTDADKAFGGHLEPGTNVFTFAIVTLGVLDGKTSLDRIDDKNYR